MKMGGYPKAYAGGGGVKRWPQNLEAAAVEFGHIQSLHPVKLTVYTPPYKCGAQCTSRFRYAQTEMVFWRGS